MFFIKCKTIIEYCLCDNPILMSLVREANKLHFKRMLPNIKVKYWFISFNIQDWLLTASVEVKSCFVFSLSWISVLIILKICLTNQGGRAMLSRWFNS